MTDRDIYLMYSAQFRELDDNFNDLMNRAENFRQATQIVNDWKLSRLNMMQAANTLFTGNMSQIAEILKDFEAANASMERSFADLTTGAKTISQVANLINLAVGAGTKLISMV